MSEFVEYPKFIYHKTLSPRIVNSKEEHELFEDWQEKPFVEEVPFEIPLHEKSEEELREHAVKNGISKKKAQTLSKEKILELFKAE